MFAGSPGFAGHQGGKKNKGYSRESTNFRYWSVVKGIIMDA